MVKMKVMELLFIIFIFETLADIVINLPRTEEEKISKEESYWFRGQQDPSVHTDRHTQTDRDPFILS